MNGGRLKCETAGDVMLLLKSSDRVQHDLDCLKAMVTKEGERAGTKGRTEEVLAWMPLVAFLSLFTPSHFASRAPTHESQP